MILYRKLKRSIQALKSLKALAADENIIQNINKYKGFVDLFIIDTPSVSYGGTGQTYDWTILKHIKDIPYLIAGGINSENIQTVNQLKLSHQGYDLCIRYRSKWAKRYRKNDNDCKYCERR